jgi:hypothetical protein
MSTTASNYTIHLDAEGQEIYPCRCGEIHAGPYGIYDHGHHNCFHDQPLMPIADGLSLMCPQCGLTFGVEP